MKTLLISSLLLLASFTVIAQTKPAPEFMGVKIDSTMDYCIKQFLGKGFTLVKKDANITSMTGKLGADEIELYIIASLASKKVWKTAIYFPKYTDWASLKSKFTGLKDIMDNKYGTPKNDYHFFASPYEEGDGYEMTAVAVEKCDYFVAWQSEENNYTISLDISKFKQPRVSYENSANAEQNRKEKDKATSDGL